MLLIRRVFNRLCREFFPAFGYCVRCEVSWAFTGSYHVTTYKEEYEGLHTIGYFCLCEKCWQECSINQRLAFYAQSIRGWAKEHTEDKEAILDAVRAGR